jgi:hypothetical protein
MSIPFDHLKYNEQPYEVSIETKAVCNAACSFCTYPNLERIGVEMPYSLLIILVEEMATFKEPFFFSPFKVNEPFLDKRVIPLCQYVNKRVPLAKLRLFSNGTPLTLPLIESIARLQNVEHLWISLNSVDPTEYETLMKLPFIRTADKLDMLHTAKIAGSFTHPVVLSRVAAAQPEHNYDFLMTCRDRWPLFTAFIIKRDGWLGDIDAPITQIPNAPCTRWWELSIMATGKVALCCMDGHGKYQIGDLATQSILEVYNSENYKARRVALISRKAIFPCATCSY